MKYFMLDIETSAINPTEGEILEIAMLEVNLGKDGYFNPARTFHKILHYDNPELDDPWILKTHAELLTKCKVVEFQSPAEVRAEILGFMARCNNNEPLAQNNLMGLNAVVFDIPWMKHHGYLKDKDTHYRVFELSGAYSMAQTALFLSRDSFFKEANASCEWVTMPEGKDHSALYDCYKQLRTLNGAIKLLRK